MAIISELNEKENRNKNSTSPTLAAGSLSNEESMVSILDQKGPVAFVETAIDLLRAKSGLFMEEAAKARVMDIVRAEMMSKKRTEEHAKRGAEVEEMKNKSNTGAESSKAVDRKMKVEDKKEAANDESKGKKPNPGNGLDMENYSWTQSIKEVTIMIPFPQGISAKSVAYELKSKHLKFGVKGQPPIIDGELFNSVKPDDCFWNIEDGKAVSVSLTKQNQIEWWKYLVKGDPEINVAEAEPETTRHISDLDPETRRTVEKMMFDQRQKRLGLPTSDEIERNDILKNIMAKQPNMNFSGAKFA